MIDAERAREVLATYRPGTSDDADPFYAEALELCRRDPDLARWLEAQSESDEALRQAFGRIAVPDDLEARILASRPASPRTRGWRSTSLLAAAAAVALVIVARGLAFGPSGPARLDDYRNQMVAVVSNDYEPEVQAGHLDQLRSTFARLGWPSDYRVPAGIRAVPVEGGSPLEWRDEKVSLLCLETADERYVWLYVIDRSVLSDAPAVDATPELIAVGGFRTSAWSRGDWTYLLVAEGDEVFVRGLLPEGG